MALNQGPIEIIGANIQTKIGEFLALKEKLMRLKYHKDQSVQAKASLLYASQITLEDVLSNKIIPILDRLKSGAYSITDTVNASAFTATLLSHIKKVKSLVNQAGPLPALGFWEQINMTYVIISSIALFGLWTISRRRA